MIESPNKRAVIVGVFVFTGLVFLLAGILIVGNLRETFKRKMEVVSLFEDVAGLQKGNNIWLSGVKIGTVDKLNFYGKSQVEVRMSIDTKAQQFIPKDSKVKISNDGLIGNKILIIYGGTPESPSVDEGDTLRVEKTFSSEDMINTLQENNKNLLSITTDFKGISQKIANGEGTIGKLLIDEAIYNHLDAATLSLQNTAIQAQKLISSLTIFSEGLNKKGSLAHELTSDTVVYNSLKTSVVRIQQMADTAHIWIYIVYRFFVQ